jgi:hypothetical protein
MDKKVLKKMQRFVELSVKFSKSESDVFPKNESHNSLVNNTHYGTLCIGSSNGGITMSPDYHTFVINGKSIYVDENNNVKAKDAKPLTRAEQILAEAEIKARLSNEFDEYNKLRDELMTFLNAHENLAK